FVTGIFVALLFAFRGGGSVRSTALAILIATLAAGLVAVALYYAWFTDTYRAEFARIGHETANATPDVGGRTLAARLRPGAYELGIYIGAPVLLFGFLGAVELARRRGGDRLTLTLAGWMASCVAFLVVGILTPVDMRYYLAALPALAIAAGYGAAWAWNDGW